MTTKWQAWMRAYSSSLMASFDGSSQIEHRVTKGETRETQILDFLDSLLPQRATVGRNVVVIDQLDTESPKFDGVLIDRYALPLLHKDGDVLVSMIESVCLCIEVKSAANPSDVADILSKSQALRSMAWIPGGPWAQSPWVTAFAYGAPNVNLSFLDYALAFRADPMKAPAHLCILNTALFLSLENAGGASGISNTPTATSSPAILNTGQDSLLVYLYILSRLVGGPSSPSEILQAYSRELLADQTAFTFGDDFLDLLIQSEDARNQARAHFKGTAARSIAEVYEEARVGLGI